MNNLSKLNLYYQKLKLKPPSFTILKKDGQDHSPLFEVQCEFDNYIETGQGTTLKSAREDAASKVVIKMDLDLELQNTFVYSFESSNIPLKCIWKNVPNQVYNLTISRKSKNGIEYKNVKFKLVE